MTEPTCQRRIALEAAALYRDLYDRPIPPDLARNYERAAAMLLPGSLPRVRVDIARIVERQLDSCAIEFYLRVRHRSLNEVGQRQHILMYLAEVHPEHRSSLHLARSSRLSCWLELSSLIFSQPLLLAKGWLQTVRHRLLITP